MVKGKIDEYAEEPSAEEVSEEMIEKEIEKEAKKIVEPVKEMSRSDKYKKRAEEDERARLANWKPKTKLGMEVRAGKIKNIDEIFDSGRKILEAEIVPFKLTVTTLTVTLSSTFSFLFVFFPTNEFDFAS